MNEKRAIEIKSTDYGLLISVDGELFQIDYTESMGVTYEISKGYIPVTKITRAECKYKREGRIYNQFAYGSECNKQIWCDNMGMFWFGDDWYDDNTAILYPAYYCPF